MTALQADSIRVRIEESLKVILGFEEERELDAGAVEEDVAPMEVCCFGFADGSRKWTGMGQIEIEKPRASSVWLRIVEWERAYLMFWESAVFSINCVGHSRTLSRLTEKLCDLSSNDIVLQSTQSIHIRIVYRIHHILLLCCMCSHRILQISLHSMLRFLVPSRSLRM